MMLDMTQHSRRAFLAAASAATAAVAATPLALDAAPAAATTTGFDDGPGHREFPQFPDRDLRALLRQIDSDRIEATVRRLVAFGTRHTLSSQDDPVRGIGAARDWLRDQFQAIAAASGGRMTVELQSFVQPAGPPHPDPDHHHQRHRDAARAPPTPDRVYVVSGHYDSRVTDVLNFTADAPGADDDGSGVAAVLELARVLRHPADRGDHHLRRGGRRGAGPVRVGVHGRAAQGGRHRHPGHVQQRHHRHRQRARRHADRPVHGAAVRRGRADGGDRRSRPRSARPSAARTTGRRASWAGS